MVNYWSNFDWKNALISGLKVYSSWECNMWILHTHFVISFDKFLPYIIDFQECNNFYFYHTLSQIYCHEEGREWDISMRIRWLYPKIILISFNVFCYLNYFEF